MGIISWWALLCSALVSEDLCYWFSIEFRTCPILICEVGLLECCSSVMFGWERDSFSWVPFVLWSLVFQVLLSLRSLADGFFVTTVFCPTWRKVIELANNIQYLRLRDCFKKKGGIQWLTKPAFWHTWDGKTSRKPLKKKMLEGSSCSNPSLRTIVGPFWIYLLFNFQTAFFIWKHLGIIY